VTGPRCGDLERDPLAAWFRASTVLLEHGVLDGFRRGWRKHYVEFLDASVPALLAAMIEAGGAVPIIAIQDSAWGGWRAPTDTTLTTPPSAGTSTGSSRGSSLSSPTLGPQSATTKTCASPN
jgi:hypothetical protein